MVDRKSSRRQQLFVRNESFKEMEDDNLQDRDDTFVSISSPGEMTPLVSKSSNEVRYAAVTGRHGRTASASYFYVNSDTEDEFDYQETPSHYLRRRKPPATSVTSCCLGEGRDTLPRKYYNGTKFLSTKYESLDYEVMDNQLHVAVEKKKTGNQYFWVNLARWVVMFFIGIFTAVIAVIIDIGIDQITTHKFIALRWVIYYTVDHVDIYLTLLTWMGMGMALVAVAGILVIWIEPVAAGSGIPEIKCYLNGVKVPHVVRIKTLFTKVVGVLFSVSGGLAVGKEGPMIHAGAVVAAGISQARATSFKIDFKRFLPVFEQFRTDTEKRDFVAGGAAAGVAAAFGAPVGGVLFSLEEGASFWRQALTWRIFFCSMVSVFTLNTLLSIYHGHPGQLDYNGLLNFGSFDSSPYQWFELPIFALMGVLGGLLGALFNSLNYHITLFRRRYIRSKIFKFLEVLVVAGGTAFAACVSVFLMRECKPHSSMLPHAEYIELFCGPGEHNTISVLFLSTPEKSIKYLYHEAELSYGWQNLLEFACVYFVLTCWTYGLSVPSGLFVPNILVGAAWGRLIGRFVHALKLEGVSGAGKYALVGSAAMLGGVVRMTISLTVIIVEATGNLSYALPIMLAIMIAKWVGDFFNEGLYDIHIKLNSIPLLDWESPEWAAGIRARHIMSKPVFVCKEVEKVGNIVNILTDTIHSGFPVVDTAPSRRHYGRFRGLILRSQLLVLLKHRDQVMLDSPDDHVEIDLPFNDYFRDAYPRFPDLDKIKSTLSDEDENRYINLKPYVCNTPYTAYTGSYYPKIFALFRALGLRHLVVVNRDNEVVGIVTRKDLARYREHSSRCSSSLTYLNIL